MGLSCLITQQRVKTHINLGDDHEGDPHVLGVLSFLAAFLMVHDGKFSIYIYSGVLSRRLTFILLKFWFDFDLTSFTFRTISIDIFKWQVDVNLVSSAGDEAATWLRPTGEGISSDYHHFYANYDDSYGTRQPWKSVGGQLITNIPWVIRAWGSVEEAVGVEIVAPFIVRVVQTI